MNYYELLFTTITTEDYQQDLLIGALGDIGFDTFEEVDLGFKAYIPVDDFNQELLDDSNPKNAAELFACADIDGGLIGGASLKSRDFTDIVKAFN